jgi:hypothetical protein
MPAVFGIPQPSEPRATPRAGASYRGRRKRSELGELRTIQIGHHCSIHPTTIGAITLMRSLLRAREMSGVVDHRGNKVRRSGALRV